MAGAESKTTTDHNTIKRWVEDRNGKPVSVKGTGKGDDPGLLRIDFPEQGSEGKFEELSWDEFFKKFDEKKLTFLYQDKTADGKESRFSKFISRES